MLEIGIHGRRGQGVGMARQILDRAFLESGQRGRVITVGAGKRADYALVLDPALLADVGCASLRGGGVIVVNSPSAPCGFSPRAAQVVDVDASRIAEDAGLGAVVAPAVLGAFAAATGLVTLDALDTAFEASAAATRAASMDACTAGYLAVRAARGSCVTGTP